ncbi:MAG TPA: tetratricopeptide repeat protein [Chloroflexota bacterium]|nr:tetratricopeptide repeat protein [Chloroflexota bacterium]
MAARGELFGDVLRRLRLAAGLTQEELAERAGMSVRSISDLERGRNRSPYRATVQRVIDVLQPAEEDAATLWTLAVRRKGPAGLAPPAPVIRLPHPLTPILGREQETGAILHLLRWEGVRLLILTGPGGVGKTRLALHVAAQAAEEFAGGATFVSLATITDPALVPTTLAAALGIRLTGSATAEQALLTHLTDQELLLVLDNLEQVRHAGPFVAELVSACPRLKALVTSRTPLQVRGEQQFEVSPLWVPAADQLAAAGADRSPAVALFRQRAHAALPGFVLDDGNLPAVAAICRHLDGIPLAIELAAAQVKLLSPTAMLARLADRFALLSTGSADAPARQRTMRDTIAWSYDLLEPAHQTLFRTLAVFAGGFDMPAVEAVAGGGTVLDGLRALVEQSLVTRQGKDRFTLLETVRAYAVEQLEAAGESQTVRERHAAYYLRLAGEAEPQLTGSELASWQEQLEAELGNIRAALAWSEESGQVEIGLRILAALWRAWVARGHVAEGRDRIRRLLAGREQRVSSWVRGRALFAAGAFAYYAGDYPAAKETWEECLELWRELDDPAGIALTLNGLASVATDQGRHDISVAYLDECIGIRRGLGDAYALGTSLHNRATVARYQGEYRLAQELYRESLELYRSAGADAASGMPLGGLAAVSTELGDYDSALTYGEEAVAAFRHSGSLPGLALAYLHLGGAAAAVGDHAGERAAFEKGFQLFRDAGVREGMANARLNLARCELDDGNPDEARTLCHEALDVLREIGHRRSMVGALFLLGDIDQADNRMERAARRYAEGLAMARELGYPRGEIQGLERLAHLACVRVELSEARLLYGKASKLRIAIGMPMSAREVATYEEDTAAIGIVRPAGQT